MAKVSVVVPMYQVEDYLPKAIDSLVSQTLQDLQIILVNDGSPDRCGEIAEQYAKQDKRITVLHKTNGGLSDARNAGMQLATSKYIYFFDSDDFLEPQCLQLCYEKLEETGADMVMFEIYQYYMKTGKKERICNAYADDQCYTLKDKPEMLTTTLNAAWNKMYRLSLFVDHQIDYPFRYYYEDLGTTYRLMLKANKIALINQPLYNYLVDRPGNITTQFSYNAYHVLGMAKMNIDFFKREGVFEQYYEELKFLCSVNILENLKKTRNVEDKKLVDEFIDVCFYELKLHFPDFPKCKYNILREKHNWIYANKFYLKSYLWLKRLRRA